MRFPKLKPGPLPLFLPAAYRLGCKALSFQCHARLLPPMIIMEYPSKTVYNPPTKCLLLKSCFGHGVSSWQLNNNQDRKERAYLSYIYRSQFINEESEIVEDYSMLVHSCIQSYVVFSYRPRTCAQGMVLLIVG